MVEVKSHSRKIKGKVVSVRKHNRKQDKMAERDFEEEDRARIRGLNEEARRLLDNKELSALSSDLDNDIAMGEIENKEDILDFANKNSPYQKDLEVSSLNESNERMRSGNKNDVIDFYASRGQGGIKTSNRSLSTSRDSRVLYSYDTPIAYRSRDGQTTFLNATKYSSTTSAQQNAVKREIPNAKLVTEKEIRKIMDRQKIYYTRGRL